MDPTIGGEAKAVQMKTLTDKIGAALELTIKIKEILRINTPEGSAGEPKMLGKVSEAKTGMEMIIENLRGIRETISEL